MFISIGYQYGSYNIPRWYPALAWVISSILFYIAAKFLFFPLLFTVYMIAGASLFAYLGHIYGGPEVARCLGIVGAFISYGAFYMITYIHDFLFIPYPIIKRCSKQCHPHYDNWIPLKDDIFYRKCLCGNEYVLFSFRYLAKFRKDGTLQPYLKRVRLKWRKDDGSDHFIKQYIIPSELIHMIKTDKEKNTP